MKFLPKVSIPSHTPFEALQRFALLSEWLYPQFITWNRVTSVATVTPRKYLVKSYALTVLLALADVDIFVFCLTQLMSQVKDPDLKIPSAFVMNACVLSFTIAVAISVTYIFKSDQLCFILHSLTKMEVVINDKNREQVNVTI